MIALPEENNDINGFLSHVRGGDVDMSDDVVLKTDKENCVIDKVMTVAEAVGSGTCVKF